MKVWDSRPALLPVDLPYADLIRLTPLEQIELVDALPRGDALDALSLAGLWTAMRSKLLPVVRNNIACRLVNRENPDPEIWRDFARMYADKDEDPVWCEYSIQFLSLSIPFAADKVAATAALVDIARADRESMATTALLHLVRLAGEGVIPPIKDLEEQIRLRIEDPKTCDAVRHTAFALAGEEGLTNFLPLARKELTSPRGDDALRGALFVLGKIGTSSDAGLVQTFKSATNPAIVLAANAALDRLSKRGNP
jgi:hypothetical protein